MRRAEIVHARPAWFHINANPAYVKVPGRETQRLANGKTHQWRSKNGKDRMIPLSKKFVAWLRDNLDTKALFAIEPDSCSKRYRYDPRTAFENYIAAYVDEHEEQPGFSMHDMRHSYITHLCNSGNASITIMKVSAWSGDRIETIERHYWERNVDSKGLDDILAGIDSTTVSADSNDVLAAFDKRKRVQEDEFQKAQSRAFGLPEDAEIPGAHETATNRTSR
jgi:integrase